MPLHPPIIETIRNGLIGALTDFVQDSGFIAELNLVVDLVYELAEYREEDVPFFPNVYLLKQTEENDPLSMIAPGADRIYLKTIDIREGAVAILKDCAALSDDGWSVFVEVSENQAR